MDFTERRIVEAVIDLALQKGYSITVVDDYDGMGDRVIRNSVSKEAILKVMGTTGSDRLYFSNGGAWVGWVTFVWGNGEDVIADCSEKVMDICSNV